MQAKNLAFVIAQATDKRQKDPLALAVAESVEQSVVVTSILRENLEDAGFKLVEDEAALSEYGFASTKFLQRVLIEDADGELVAMGAAVDQKEALLHAVLGWFREHPLADAKVPASFAEAPGAPN